MNQKHRKLITACLLYIPVVLLSLMILGNLYLGISKAVTGVAVPKLLGFSPLVVMSGSMKPAIYPGDVVVIKEQGPELYKSGDVASYLMGQIVYTHRIVSVEDGMFVMKGDSNNTVDDIVAADKLEGKVILTIPKVGMAVIFFKTPLGVGVLAVLLLLSFYLKPAIEKLKKHRQIKRGVDH